MKIHVGNLAPATKSEDLHKAFEAFGEVSHVNLVADKDTGKPRGFAFIEMPKDEEGSKAIAALHEKDMQGNAVTVQEARKKGEATAK